MSLLNGGIAAVFAAALSGIYLPATVYRPIRTDDGAGSVTVAWSNVTARAQIDSATEAMRQQPGYTGTDVRIIVLSAGVPEVTTDCEINVSGKRYAIANVARDPANAYYDCRGQFLRLEGDVSPPTGIPGVAANNSGWGFYKHTGASQALAADTEVALVNDQGFIIETQKPADVTTFFAANKITGRIGDALVAQIDFVFTPSDEIASMVQLWIDIGGGFPPSFRRIFPITLGSGVAHAISMTIAPYTLTTWAANGGAIIVRSDGGGVITGQTIVISRTHKAQ